MNIYTKILFTTLPLVFFILFAAVGTTYHFARMALTDLAETWLQTRLSEAVRIVAAQEEILHKYGLEEIPASNAKAKLDAGTALAAIEVGAQGYIFAVSANGTVAYHPDSALQGQNVRAQAWFAKLKSGQGRLTYVTPDGRRHLARYDYFEPWQWYIIATDPEAEVYGVANRMRPYVIYLGIFGAVVLALALMLLTRRLTQPLRELTNGADSIGKGDLETRIAVTTHDEFGQLSAVFNRMSGQLQETLTTLQRREEHFRSIIENASDIIAILDAQGLILYASPSVERVLGYQPAVLVGTDVRDYLHPEGQAPLTGRIEWLQSTGTAIPGQFRFRHSDGSWRTFEGVRDNLLDHPAVEGLVINARDITKRKEAEDALQKSHQELEKRVLQRTEELTLANRRLRNEIEERTYVEEALRNSEQRLRAILRASPVGIGLVIDRHMSWCNEALLRIMDYAKEDVIGIDSAKLYPDPDEYKRVGAALYEGASRSEIGQVDTHMLRGDGTVIDCSIRSCPLNPEDPSMGQIIAVTDITERKRTQDMLMQTEKMVSVGGLAAGMAHEINNPLAGILQNTQVLSRRMKADLPANTKAAAECGLSMDGIEKYMALRGLFSTIDTVVEAGRRAAKIVENMLSFSRKSESKFGYHGLDRLLDKTVELAENDYDLKTRFDFRKIEIVREYTPDTPVVQCESSKLQQVFLNILRNSSQAMTEGDSTVRSDSPRFVLRVRPEGELVRVEIEDNGPGMPEEVRKRVFEPFFTTKNVGVGTGLGLSVSYFIITENHRGTMEVKSSPGKGACFIIRIPVRREQAA